MLPEEKEERERKEKEEKQRKKENLHRWAFQEGVEGGLLIHIDDRLPPSYQLHHE